MASFTPLVGLLVSALLCVQVHGQNSEVRVVFTEVDFRMIEGTGQITAFIIKEGPLISDLYMNIIPLTYDEFDARGFQLDEVRRQERPDPAEFDVNGRMDFDNSVQTLILEASITSDDYMITIPVTKDSINEESEGFMIVMRPDEGRSNPEDVARLTYQNNGVALGVIDDDDPIVLGFERSSYTVQEADSTVQDLVALVKQEGIVTEQTITLAVSTIDISAKEEMDYRRIEQLVVTFQPGQMRLTLPFTLIDDTITEPNEAFGLLVSRKLNNPNLLLGIDSAIITIEETDVVEIRFNQTVYIVDEGGSVSVCVDIVGSVVVDDDLPLLLSIVTTGAGTASADDFNILSNFLALSNDVRQSCVIVDGVDDSIPEPTENVTLTLALLPPGSDNVIINTSTTLLINSNECEEGTSDCFDNSMCTDTALAFECRCPEGFIDLDGDGRNCIDIDECEENLGNCGDNAVCANTIGSFECQCLPGFSGNGLICIDINECEDGLDDCDPFADCTNTVGSFECQCQEGFTGDGRECIISQPSLVNECETGVHDCSPFAKCIDLDNGFECRCRPGYVGNGRICRDLNECSVGGARCYPHSRCVNLPGSYSCVCDPGYAPWGRMCMDINECRDGSNRCDENARCDNTPGSYSCTCNDGFTGDGLRCAEEQREPECGPGYRPWGLKCMDIHECREGLDTCDENAFCTNTLGSYTCTCRPGYTGNGFTCTELQLTNPCDEVDDDTRTTTRGTRTRGTKSPKKGTKSRQTDPNTPRGRHGRRADTLCRQQDDSSRSTRRTTKKTKTRRT